MTEQDRSTQDADRHQEASVEGASVEDAAAPAEDAQPVPRERPQLTDSERAAAEQLFGDRLPLAERFVDHLCTTGIEHGLLGPWEVPRMWSRHVLNCAVLGPELPTGGDVADVGSGAGLPGIALAIAREDVYFTLIEPMERRVDWLSEVVKDLGLQNVTLIRGRAEEVTDEVMADVVTARAVSALKKLVPLTVPLLAEEGQLMLLKGRSVDQEIEAASKAFSKHRMEQPEVLRLGEALLEEPTTVVRCRRR
ncbi:16S rRNA (guanine(527)-N(7))-methyltransferase RsmG [Nesterenkonia halophila]|uniref:16S rRNA (guanine(527)-N(7))-methyltransferase RsmG n=1 Tax=Nesterenkonia halophila TaxID=302044 RepID=UPI001FE5B78E|nr:16S rRNA (guanine(527)-N(7))-methyltransferase RsmG [Nesterenkonia halophila]